MDPKTDHYSQLLKSFLESNGIWHRFIEFDEPVKTVEQAAKKVDIKQIAKSIVLIDSNKMPLVAILPAEKRISYQKVKVLLSVKDVRLANEAEVLTKSGYPVGGVPPYNMIRRAYVDQSVLRNSIIIAGGGDVNKLVELRTEELLEFLKPIVADLTK